MIKLDFMKKFLGKWQKINEKERNGTKNEQN
jgi:hypothetical protein